MFDKLAPVPIKNSKHRNLMIFSMSWFLIGTWVDASAHSYLNGDLESFLHHGMLCYIPDMHFLYFPQCILKIQ